MRIKRQSIPLPGGVDELGKSRSERLIEHAQHIDEEQRGAAAATQERALRRVEAIKASDAYVARHSLEYRKREAKAKVAAMVRAAFRASPREAEARVRAAMERGDKRRQ